MRKFGEQETKVRRSVAKLMNSVAACYSVMAICMSRAIRKPRLRERSKLDCFIKHLRWN